MGRLNCRWRAWEIDRKGRAWGIRVSRCEIIQGDAFSVLASLPAESAHTCITSPPYWGLRDYGVKDQIGLENTPDDYIWKLVQVFREVRRVLRNDGTLWLNLGDSYTSGGRDSYGTFTPDSKQATHPTIKSTPRALQPPTMKPKDLVGIPWMAAFALRADGWYLRSDIIWSKPNPMPESVTDRPTKAHEYLFLLAKSERYYYDAEAIRESLTESSIARISQPTFDNQNGGPKDPRNGGEGSRNRSARQGLENLAESYRAGRGLATGTLPYAGLDPENSGGQSRHGVALENEAPRGNRNRRTVWTIPTAPYPEAHFATFPPDLVRPCILAGTSERGCCGECGAPWVRVTESVDRRRSHGTNSVIDGAQGGNRRGGTSVFVTAEIPVRETTGWNPSCKCDSGEPIPATVLDPFLGSGTTLAVALEYGRRGIGIELIPEYIELARKRIEPFELQGILI